MGRCGLKHRNSSIQNMSLNRFRIQALCYLGNSRKGFWFGVFQCLNHRAPTLAESRCQLFYRPERNRKFLTKQGQKHHTPGRNRVPGERQILEDRWGAVDGMPAVPTSVWSKQVPGLSGRNRSTNDTVCAFSGWSFSSCLLASLSGALFCGTGLNRSATEYFSCLSAPAVGIPEAGHDRTLSLSPLARAFSGLSGGIVPFRMSGSSCFNTFLSRARVSTDNTVRSGHTGRIAPIRCSNISTLFHCF